MRISNRKLTVYLFFGVVSLFISLDVRADSVPTQCSYSIRLDDGLSFVMIAVLPFNECASQGTEKIEAGKAIRKKYQISGLYRDDAPGPLWTVDWYSYKVFISSDGKNLVRIGPWASNTSDEAFSFFNNGQLVKTYQVGEIIRYDSALPHSVSHFQWEKQFELNDSKRTFEVTTLEDGRFTFNLLNGEIISQRLPLLPPISGLSEPRFIVRAGLILVLLFAAGLVAIYFVLRRRNHLHRP